MGALVYSLRADQRPLSQRLLVLVALVLALNAPVWAQRGKNGAGVITTAAPGAVVNAYTRLTADAAAGTTTLAVANSSLMDAAFGASLATGDLVMIMQHQGATINTANTSSYGDITAYNNAGRYELVEVRSVPSATSIVVACGLQNSYTATGKIQVVRIPRYSSLVLNANTVVTAPAWDGTTGGIVAVEVQGNITLNTGATIDVSGKGFRGGALVNRGNGNVNGATGFVYSTVENGAEKGESIAGYQADYDALGGRFGRGAPANGGGGGNNHNAGGGGGANVSSIAWTGKGNPDGNYDTAWSLEQNTPAASGGTGTSLAGTTSGGGGRGGYSYSSALENPGTLAPGILPNFFGTNRTWKGNYRRITGGWGGRPLDVSAGRLFFGGGGGAGDENDNTGIAGANGGGLIYVITGGSIAPATAATGAALQANGADALGPTADGSVRDGCGGGGGGGTIILNVAGTVAAGIATSVAGGKGGVQPYLGNDEAEGPGGGGGGGYVAYTSLETPSTLGGGANGITYAKAMNPTAYAFPPNGATAGSAGTTATFAYNAQCLVTADVQTTLSGPAAITLGQSITYTLQTTNLSPDITATNVQPTLTLPPGAANVVLPPGATQMGNVVTFTLIPALAPGANNAVTYVVSYTPTATGTVTASAANGSGSPDPALANNNGQATSAIVNTTITEPLPVELIDFTAIATKNGDVALAWHTASEKNNAYFAVERSFVGTEFAAIGQLRGQGNSTSPTAYALTDVGVGVKAAGQVYYRLRQVDTDGTQTYSPVRVVAFDGAAPLPPAITLFPNPAGPAVQLDLALLPAGPYQVRLLDMTGREVLRTLLPVGALHTLDLHTLPAGVYQVLLQSQTPGVLVNLTQRLLKE